MVHWKDTGFWLQGIMVEIPVLANRQALWGKLEGIIFLYREKGKTKF